MLITDGALYPLVMAAGSAVVCVMTGVRGGWLARRARATIGWRPLEGTMLRAELDIRTRYRKGTLARSGGNVDDFRPLVEYVYTVGGKDYVGNRIYFGAHEWKAEDASLAEKLLSPFRPNARVRVFVDPKNPTQSVLERGRTAVADIYLKSSAAAGALAIALFLFSRLL